MAYVKSTINNVIVYSGTTADKATIAANVAGEGSEFWDTTTKIQYRSDGLNWILIRVEGSVLVTDPTYDYAPDYSDATYAYYRKTNVLGSALTAAVWKITRIRTADNQVSYAGSAGSFGNFNQVGTTAGLAALTYSQT